MQRIADKGQIRWAAAGLAVALFLGGNIHVRAAGSSLAVRADAEHTLTQSRGYYAMLNGRVEKWDFHADGTFVHEGIAPGVGAYARGSQQGTYAIDGDKLILKIGSSGTALGARAGSNSFVGGSSGAALQTRDMRIQLLGPDGANGVVLNGVTFHIRHGW